MPLPATTRLFEIKLSGIDGLAPRYFGDIDRNVATPNLRVANQDNQDATSGTNRTMVGGIYNPFRRYGYLSAANNIFNTVHVNSGNPISIPSVAIYDRINKHPYFAERTPNNNLMYGTSLDDTNFTYSQMSVSTLSVVTDFEIYQINGVRKLFYTYSFPSTAITVTFSSVADTVTTPAGVSVAGNSPITFSTTGSLPTASGGNITAGTVYWVINSSGTQFQIARTKGGAAIDLTSNGSGTNTINANLGGWGIQDLPAANDNATFGTLSVSGAFNLGNNYPFMIRDASFLYFLDGPSIHRLDGNAQTGGANGTIVQNVLYFPSYYNFVDGVDFRGNLYLATHDYSNNIRGNTDLTETEQVSCGVTVWNKSDTVASNADYIPIMALKEIRKIYVSPTGYVRLIGVTSEDITVIMEYDGSKFNHVVEVGYNAYPEYIDSFTNAGFFVTWIANDGNIYAHGLAQPDEKKEGLFIIGNKSDLAIPGAILFGGSNSQAGVSGYKQHRTGLIIGYLNNTGGNRLVNWDIYGTGLNSTTPVPHAGNVYTPVYYLTEVLGFTHYPSQLANVNYIEIYTNPTLTADSTVVGTINLYFNQSSSVGWTHDLTAQEASRGYYRCEVNAQYINAVQIEVVFSSNNVPGSGYDTSFSTAVIVYEPTNTKG